MFLIRHLNDAIDKIWDQKWKASGRISGGRSPWFYCPTLLSIKKNPCNGYFFRKKWQRARSKHVCGSSWSAGHKISGSLESLLHVDRHRLKDQRNWSTGSKVTTLNMRPMSENHRFYVHKRPLEIPIKSLLVLSTILLHSHSYFSAPCPLFFLPF